MADDSDEGVRPGLHLCAGGRYACCGWPAGAEVEEHEQRDDRQADDGTHYAPDDGAYGGRGLSGAGGRGGGSSHFFSAFSFSKTVSGWEFIISPMPQSLHEVLLAMSWDPTRSFIS